MSEITLQEALNELDKLGNFGRAIAKAREVGQQIRGAEQLVREHQAQAAQIAAQIADAEKSYSEIAAKVAAAHAQAAETLSKANAEAAAAVQDANATASRVIAEANAEAEAARQAAGKPRPTRFRRARRRPLRRKNWPTSMPESRPQRLLPA